MSNYAEILHRCGNVFRESTNLIFGECISARLSGLINPTIPVFYTIKHSSFEDSFGLVSGCPSVARKSGSLAVVIPIIYTYRSENYEDDFRQYSSVFISSRLIT